MRLSKILTAGLLLTAACYKPNYSSDEDAGKAFHCYATDRPACPGDLVCCVGDLCGDALIDPISGGPIKDNAGIPLEGSCVKPRTPKDMTLTPASYWDFGIKGSYYTGMVNDPLLTGKDPDTGKWRCKRDDQNPDPAAEIKRMFEPNDMPEQAVSLSNPLPIDPTPTQGTAYEICPDQSAPDMSDVDVFKFKLSQPTKVMVRLTYKVSYGDLDVALFRIMKDDVTGAMIPQRVVADLTAVDNGCLEAPNLPAGGPYYVVVRGTNSPEKPATYTMNNYNIRVYGVQSSGDSCVAKKDGGL